MATRKRPVYLHWKKAGTVSKKPASNGVRGTELACVKSSDEWKRIKKLRPTEHESPTGHLKTGRDQHRGSTGMLSSATLRDLCTQDKQRVRQLIEQLAQIGDEKERLEEQIQADRQQFSELLGKLKLEHQKVLDERQQMVEDLQSSQLQLQQLHKYPTLPNTVPHLVQSHGLLDHMTPTVSHMTPSTCHMTPSTGHMTPSTLASTDRSTSAATSLPNRPPSCHMTSNNSHMMTPDSCAPQKQSHHRANGRGNGDSTPSNDDWHTLPPSSPQCTVSSKPSLVTEVLTIPTTQSTTPTAPPVDVHQAPIAVVSEMRVQTPVGSCSTVAEASTQTLNVQSSATQTEQLHLQHTLHDRLTVSDLAPLVTMETTQETHPLQHKPAAARSVKVKGQLPTPNSFLLPTKLTPKMSDTCVGQPSKGTQASDHLSESTFQPRRSKLDSSTLDSTSSNVVFAGMDRGIQTDRIDAASHPSHTCVLQDDLSIATHETSTELDSLLATALLNAQQTLYTISTLSYSVRKNSSLNGSTVAMEGQDNSSKVRPDPGQWRRNVGVVKDSGRLEMDSRSTTATSSSGSGKYTLSSPECELTLSLNPRATSSSHSANAASLKHNHLGLPVSGQSSDRSFSTTDSVGPSSVIPGRGTTSAFEESQFKLKSKSARMNRSAHHLAKTSTPFPTGGRNGMSLEQYEPQLASTAVGSDDDLGHISDIFEHAHHLSKRDIYTEHAQSLRQRLQRVDKEDDNFSNVYTQEECFDSNSDTSSCSTVEVDLIEDLFFV